MLFIRVCRELHMSHLLFFKGSSGSVFKATYNDGPDSFSTIACKRLHANTASFAEIVDEALKMAILEHENIIKFIGVSVVDVHPIIALEFMPKGNLQSYLCHEVRTLTDTSSAIFVHKRIYRVLQ